MPRRPPPTSLILATGPTPARNVPKHTLPAPPRPTFFPSSSPSRSSSPSTTPRSRSSSRASSPDYLSNMFTPGFHLRMAPGAENYGGSYLIDGMGVDAAPYVVASAQKSSGPWDRSRSLSLSGAQVDGLISAPKPVVPNPIPLW